MKKTCAFLAAGLLLASNTGCFGGSASGLSISSVNILRPTLNVGETTDLLIDAKTMPFRTITYNVICNRGRVAKVKGTDGKYRYYAPLTSRAPNQQGNMEEGDILTVQVNDGYDSKTQQISINLTGSTMVMVQGGNNSSSQPENGRLMVASVDSGGSSLSSLRTLKDALGNELRGTSPVISPDGRKVAYVNYPGTGSQIMTVDVAGNIINLTGNSAGFNLDPTWSPSSHELAFVSDRAGNYDLYLIESDQQGNSPRRITNTLAQERHPAWNPSMPKMNYIALCANATSLKDLSSAGQNVWNLFLVDVSKGTYERQLTGLIPDKGLYAVEPSWKADGEFLAYTYYGPMYNNSSNSQPFQRIYTQRYTESVGAGVPLNQGETSQTVEESNPLWSTNGNEIAYLRSVDNGQATGGLNGELYRQTYTAGATTPERAPMLWMPGSGVPAIWRRSTQNELVGCRPVDWK